MLASQPARSLEEMAAEAQRQYEVLLGDALAQVARGHFEKARIVETQQGAATGTWLRTLVALVNLYRIPAVVAPRPTRGWRVRTT